MTVLHGLLRGYREGYVELSSRVRFQRIFPMRVHQEEPGRNSLITLAILSCSSTKHLLLCILFHK